MVIKRLRESFVQRRRGERGRPTFTHPFNRQNPIRASPSEAAAAAEAEAAVAEAAEAEQIAECNSPPWLRGTNFGRSRGLGNRRENPIVQALFGEYLQKRFLKKIQGFHIVAYLWDKPCGRTCIPFLLISAETCDLYVL